MRLIQLTIIIGFLFFSSSLIGANHPYETIWSNLVSEHTLTKQSKKVAFVYVNYEAIAKSQNFSLLLRILSGMDTQSLSKSQRLAYLINFYNIRMIESVSLKKPLENAFLDEIKMSIRELDERALFGLSGNNIYLPNLNAYLSDSFEDQLSNQVESSVQKLFRYDRSVNILYLNQWFDQQDFSLSFKQFLVSLMNPTFNYDTIDYHFSDFGVISNEIK